MKTRPTLSVIICVFNMQREAPRTILSMSLPYQKGCDRSEYEVIVLDNGSRPPLELGHGAELLPEPRVVRVLEPKPSPVFALNWAAKNLARGDLLLFAIDGARVFSDRIVANMLQAHALVPDAFVYTLGCHIGPKMHTIASAEGFDEVQEDWLIEACGWPREPDGLYGASVFAGSSAPGFFQPILESNAFSVPRCLFDRLGGFDERFTSAGGGLANLEIFARYVTRPYARNICLLSDMTFHQAHGGIATSNKVTWQMFDDEYRSIFGRSYTAPSYETFYMGWPKYAVIKFLEQSLATLPAPT